MIRCEWALVAGPQQEPLSLDDAKLDARVDIDEENAKIVRDVAAARDDAEQYMGRGLFTQTWKLELSGWVDEVSLPMAAPLQSITSVQYYAADGTLTTLATSYYEAKTTPEPGLLVRTPNHVWPALESDRTLPIIITYVVGWADVADIPARILDGIAVMARARYERLTGKAWEDSRSAAESCWASYRVWWKPPRCAAA